MMCVLSDQDIKQAIGKRLVIEPFDLSMLRPSSIRLRLGSVFMVMIARDHPIDTQASDTREWFEHVDTGDKPFILPPHTLVLAESLEKIGLKRDLTGLLNTVSSLARVGLSTHGSSGLVPAGYGERHGAKITFELFSFGSAPIILYPKMPVCHLTLLRNCTPAQYGYERGGGFYKGLSVEPADFNKHPNK